jgi:two-component system sensor kinase
LTAQYLEETDPANVFELSVHYNSAGDRDRALSNSLQAARVARQKYSLSIARDHLQIAKSWLRSDDQPTGLEVWEGLGEIELLAGQYDEAAINLEHALRLAKPGIERARVQSKVGELAFKRGRFAEAATEYEHALKMTGVRVPSNVVSMLGGLVSQTLQQTLHTWLPTNWIAGNQCPSELDCLQLQLLSRLSHVYWFSRHKLWTLGNHLRSLNTAERFAPSVTLAAVYSEHGPVMSLLRWFKRANRYANRSLSIRTELGDIWGQGQSYHYQSVVKLAECRFQDAIVSAMNAVDLLRKMGDFWEMNMARYQAANAHYRIGNYSDATDLAKQMFDCGREIGDLQATGISLDVWARTSPNTLPLDIVAGEAGKSRPDAQSHAQTQLAFAIVLLHHDRIQEAVEVLQKAIVRSETAGHLNTYISPCYAWLGTALRIQIERTERHDGRRLQQRIVEARKAIFRALRVARGFPGDRAHCLRELGLLYAIRGNAQQAAKQLSKSVESARQHNQRIEELESLKKLVSIHKLEPELLGVVQTSDQVRLDALNESFRRNSRDDRNGDAKSSNLSLADRFVTVLQSGRRIAQALSADVVYAEASEAARKLLRGQNVDVVEIQDHDGHLSFAPMYEEDSNEMTLHRMQSHDTLLRTAHSQGQAVCDASLDLKRSRAGSAIATPIAFRGTNVAIVLVTHDELRDLFSTDEQRIADFVSTLAGAALENADGFLRLRQLNDTLEQRVLDRTKAAEERAQQLAVSNEQLRATEDQLREAIVHANAANEAKGRFLATISHEIRTPLNGILGMTRLAQQATSDQRRSNYLDTVQESGQSLLTLINDLLDVSKLESGKLELEQIPVQPQAIADEICRLMAPSATQKSVELICDVEPEVPITILGDPSRLRQIIMNLIGNAIKFTERGSIQLRLNLVQEPGNKDQLSIKVQDTGIGIPDEKIKSVFDSFSQVDSSTTRRYGGTGLGLAICSELAEMMGGTIKLDSELGVGSEFTVLLPIDVPVGLPASTKVDHASEVIAESLENETSEFDSDLPRPSSASDDSQSGQPLRILVAEDGAINQEVIVGMLEMNGYEVVVANNGEEAFQKASEGSYSLCLMDVDMPKMDGIEATKMIRTKVPGADRESLPIIAMTAHCGDQIWSKCEAAGMNAYIPKPIDPKTLFENVNRFQTTAV